MSMILIVIYCLMAALLIFGITFHDELLNEERRKRENPRSLTVIQGGKRSIRPHRHV